LQKDEKKVKKVLTGIFSMIRYPNFHDGKVAERPEGPKARSSLTI